MRVCSLLIIQSLLFYNCSATQVREHYDEYDGFWNYTLGRSKNNVDPMLEPRNGKIVDEKHPYYLWFLTPEIIFNPQGGIYYPDMIVKVHIKNDGGKPQFKFFNTADLPNITDESLRNKILDKRAGVFRLQHASLVEFVLPYREITSAVKEDEVTNHQAVICGSYLLNILAIPRLIGTLFVYPIHDVIKILMLPVAGVYYTVQAFDEEDEEE